MATTALKKQAAETQGEFVYDGPTAEQIMEERGQYLLP
jgi:hypothetical protein